MGIFGPARLMPQPTSAALVAPAKVGAGYVPQPAPQGFFGRLRNMQTPEGVNPLMILGASLQEAGGQQGALAGLLEQVRTLQAQTQEQQFQRDQAAQTQDYRNRMLALQQQNARPEVQHDARSGTFWVEDPTQPSGVRILGRDPNWQPQRPLVGIMSGADGDWDYSE